ncbi:DUF4241 domain-containing protein [Verrucosispora sp. FIM060022]|nr:DUF4241 domain-containing protein [Verrucosispora sp. FIM060022]
MPPSAVPTHACPGGPDRVAWSAEVDLDLVRREDVQQIVQNGRRCQPTSVTAGDEVRAGDCRVVPHQAERCPCAEASAQTVVERVEVPAEVPAGPVDRLADRAVEPFDVGDVPPVEVIGGAGGPVGGIDPVGECHSGPVVAQLAVVVEERTGANVYVVGSGWGDGVYATYIGRTAEGDMASFVTDFRVVPLD